MPPSVRQLTLHFNFILVVQAAAINLNWAPTRDAITRFKRQLDVVTIAVSNEGNLIQEDERKSVERLFFERFHPVRAILRVTFA